MRLWIAILVLGNIASAAEVSDPTVRALQEKYGIRLLAGDVPRPKDDDIKFTQLTSADLPSLKVYLRVFAEEFNKYPPAFVKSCGVDTIVFTKDMTVNGQQRNAIPDSEARRLYFDPFGGDHSENYQRHVVHHEYFHVADHILNAAAVVADPNWASLNDPKFSYGGGGHTARGGDQGGATNREPGFWNRYSTSGIEEDKAEIFACLLIPSEMNLLEQRCRQDAILDAKVRHMKNFVRYYAKEPATPRDKSARELFTSIRARDVDAVRSKLAEDAAVISAADYHGRSPLHWAIIMRHAEMVSALLDAKANVNAPDADGWTPLHTAAYVGDKEVLELIVAAKPKSALRDRRGGTALDWARIRGHSGPVELLSRGATAPPASQRSENRR